MKMQPMTVTDIGRLFMLYSYIVRVDWAAMAINSESKRISSKCAPYNN